MKPAIQIRSNSTAFLSLKVACLVDEVPIPLGNRPRVHLLGRTETLVRRQDLGPPDKKFLVTLDGRFD